NIGTDGLSSNYSLNLWDELRAALMLHYDLNLNSLAKELLLSVTKEAACALNLNEGSLKVGKDATFIALSIPKTTKENLPIQTILHTKKAKKVYIKGEEIDV
ncbi:MAG: amidohydrolase family protein, partial [Sulfurospirillaceae bacterium]